MNHHRNQFDRRRFLQWPAAAAACVLATSSNAATTDTNPLIDTQVYLGNWPGRHLSSDTPSKLAAMLRRAGVTEAWAGTFDGLFHKDVHGANARLVDACHNESGGLFIPIGSVNPMLPDWEEDVRRCRETLKMPGIRLHPAYHGYALDDARFARLLEVVAALGLFVQLVINLSTKPQRLLSPKDSQVDLRPLAQVVRPIRGLRLLIAGAFPASVESMSTIPPETDAYIGFTRADDSYALPQLIKRISKDRIVYGSAAPLNDGTSAARAFRHSELSAGQVNAISIANPKRLRKS